jgi:hypothetical protein
MKPEEVLIEYMQDVKKQQLICLKNNNIKDAESLQVILEDFKISIELLKFWRVKNYKLK